MRLNKEQRASVKLLKKIKAAINKVGHRARVIIENQKDHLLIQLDNIDNNESFQKTHREIKGYVN